MAQTPVVGIAWFRPEDYDAARASFVDGDNLPASYEEWRKAAEGLREHLQRQGIVVEHAYIDPVTFPHWCEERGMRLDAKARTGFASEFAAAKHRKR